MFLFLRLITNAAAKVPPEITTARMTTVGFLELVLKRGSLAVLSVGDGVAGENGMAVPLGPTGDGVCE